MTNNKTAISVSSHHFITK